MVILNDLLTGDECSLLEISRVEELSTSDFVWGDNEIKQADEWARLEQEPEKKPAMSYKAGIFDAISALKDTGSSSIAIKKHMQTNLPKDKKWMNAMYLKALNKAVANGELTKNKGSFNLSATKKKSKRTTTKRRAAPKKNAASKSKTYLEKRVAPKKKAVSLC